MELVLWLLVVQGILGAFDLVYHHEMTEKLTWKPGAADEMFLHALRNGLYAVVFLSLGFFHWHGALMWVFAAILLAEVTITLTDFVVEDRTRKLPETERVTHTVLALNYGAVLGLMIPEFTAWQAQDTGFAPVYYGLPSLVMGFYAVGVLAWFFRDLFRSIRLRRMARTPHELPRDASLKGKSVLVSGGTGFIGHALCRSLIESGALVTVLTRDIAAAAARVQGRVTFIDSLSRLTPQDKFDIIINLAGESIAQRWTFKASERIFSSRIGTTQAIVKFIQSAETKPAVFISGSAIGYYGVSDTAEFRENDTPLASGGGDFAKTLCRDWEAAALAARDSGVRTVILRTGLVLERDGGTLAELLFPFDFFIGGPMGQGTQWFSWIHRDDVLGLVFHAIRNQGVSGAINVTAPQPATNAEFSQALGKAMRRPSWLPLPPQVLKAVFGRMAEEIMLSGQKVLPEKALTTGYAFRYPDITAAMRGIFST